MPNVRGRPPIPHGSKVKASLTLANGSIVDRIPAWISYVIQNPDNKLFDAVYWSPPTPYEWIHPTPPAPKSLRIYEAHVGMSSVEAVVNSYDNFTDQVLPKILESGYNCVQLMAIMEHAYYGSFGYHVTNFFAISSRFGTPESLKRLIDTAHSLGMIVLMDLIHSHASCNVLDGLNQFDGTAHHYFHEGPRGRHTLWDSRCFNYSHWEVQRFLLSNLRWYLEEYHFDGFRFDGVTAMLYKHHGISYDFSGQYHEYFQDNLVDIDAQVYLMLANDLIHSINPNAITIGEDVSGMPALCRPVQEGGFGFDYRLNMSVPDKWIKLIKEVHDENWIMGDIVYTLTNRRFNEKCVAYVESHDQSIVGDKTQSMWLFDREIYSNMDIASHRTTVVDRGLALHKMIRLITMALGGEAYLNFMGNEFGHPEWVDFPREGNGYTHWMCRRQWNLRDNSNLRYFYLWEFDKAMHGLEVLYPWLSSKEQYITLKHEKDKVIIFEQGELLWVFNFNPTKSFEHYRVGTKWHYEHGIVLDTDETRFQGLGRLEPARTTAFPIMKSGWCGRPNYIQLYIPSRCAMVLKPLITDEERMGYGLDPLCAKGPEVTEVDQQAEEAKSETETVRSIEEEESKEIKGKNLPSKKPQEPYDHFNVISELRPEDLSETSKATEPKTQINEESEVEEAKALISS